MQTDLGHNIVVCHPPMLKVHLTLIPSFLVPYLKVVSCVLVNFAHQMIWNPFFLSNFYVVILKMVSLWTVMFEGIKLLILESPHTTHKRDPEWKLLFVCMCVYIYLVCWKYVYIYLRMYIYTHTHTLNFKFYNLKRLVSSYIFWFSNVTVDTRKCYKLNKSVLITFLIVFDNKINVWFVNFQLKSNANCM